MKEITIMIVDDHSLIREAFSFVLSINTNFKVVANTGNVKEANELAGRLHPDIILLDINMPEISGFDMIDQLRNNSSRSRIIGLSAHTLPVYVKKMIRSGARGYLTKNSTIAEMTRAIIQVSEGEIFLCQEVKDLITDQALNNQQDTAGVQNITGREAEMLGYLNKGFSSKEIAAELNISVRTVEVHRHRILKKLKMKNMIAAVTYFNSYAA